MTDNSEEYKIDEYLRGYAEGYRAGLRDKAEYGVSVYDMLNSPPDSYEAIELELMT